MFADHVTLYDEMKQVTWHASIPHGGNFAAKNKANISTPDRFTKFLAKCDPAGVATVIVRLEKTHAKKSKYGPVGENIKAGEDWAPNTSALVQAHVMKIVATLQATHPPRPRLTGKHETGVLVNPKKDSDFVLLTTERLILWAQAMAVYPEVTHYVPPVSPAFDWGSRSTREPWAANLSANTTPQAAVPATTIDQPLPNESTPWNGSPILDQQLSGPPMYPHIPQPMGH
ncbi:hypothetical protein Pst134EA_026707 [Puccinia striiformis f. sp. tritici]|uniref:Uncharacterized protein n=1 Tax=Puccinia striiformis f. sp. tritici PST-78 TaxID=1165861 RepID=A0A0L0W3Y0_9BASI|nr:hypothetical protein Pst134EA_026707 [Puccinia striiformis f. sp. tritici]KAH9449994.1 hypothetical protein Pst134EA_026707 [Puccinia striiformis f. sp. tritici]KNF06209.1 hypothetical protein PSTG_00717 [Puccinia striiformis f. sp. tritici PST-78]